jgi:hypothetical protein
MTYELYLSFGINENICWFQVSVNDILAMDVNQRLEDLA